MGHLARDLRFPARCETKVSSGYIGRRPVNVYDPPLPIHLPEHHRLDRLAVDRTRAVRSGYRFDTHDPGHIALHTMRAAD